MSKLVSVILTGGKSSRMGYENKSFLKIKDKYFIEILIESLQGKSNDIIINAIEISVSTKYLVIKL